MAAGMNVRGITITLNADLSEVVKEFKNARNLVKDFKADLSALQKNLISDNSWDGLGKKFEGITLKQELLGDQAKAVEEKLKAERIALAALSEEDQTPEVIQKQKQLRMQILLDEKELQNLQTELDSLGSLTNQKFLSIADAFKEARENIVSYKDDFQSLQNKILNDNSFRNLELKFKAIKEEQVLLQKEIGSVKAKLTLEKEELAALSQADQTPEVIARQEKLQAQILLDEKELQNLEEEYKNFGSIAKQNVTAVGGALIDVGDEISSVGDKLITVGRNLTTYVTTPVVAVGATAVKTAADFETAMDKVQAVTLGATTADMNELREMALALSSDSKYSAAETAEALYYMGLAGWDVSEMMESLPDVLNLATAGDMDLGRASDIVTDYITAFGLSAKDSTRFVDVMAKTMANSNTDVDQLGDAFKYVAPVAGSLGYSVEDVSFALGLMANNGVKASQAGTSLRQFMQRLAKPTAEVQTAMDELGLSLTDADGNMKSFRTILDDLREVLGESAIPAEELSTKIRLLDDDLENGTITEEEYGEAMEDLMEAAYGTRNAEKAKNAAILAGTRGMSGLLAIVNTTAEDYDTLTEAIEGTEQSAKSVADTMLDNTEGAFERVKHSAQNLAISFGDILLPKTKDVIDWAQNLVNKYNDLDDGTKEIIIQVAALAAGIGPLLLVGGSLIKTIGSVVSGVGSIAVFAAAHPILTAVVTLAAVIGGLIVAEENHKKAVAAEIEEIYGLTDAEKSLIEEIDKSYGSYQKNLESRAETAKSIDTEIGYYKNLRDELALITDENGRVKEGYEARAEFIVGELSEALGMEITINDGLIEDYKLMQTEIDNLITKKRQELALQKGEEQYKKAIESQTGAYEDYTEAVEAHDKAVASLTRAQAEATKTQNKINSLWDEYNEELAETGEANGTILTQIKALEGELKTQTAAVETAKSTEEALAAAMEESQEVYLQTQRDIELYGDALEAVASGDTEAARNAINALLYDFRTFDTSTEKQLQDQVSRYQKLYEQAQKDIAAGTAGVTKETVETYAEMVRLAEEELKKFESAGETGAEYLKKGLTSVDMHGPGSEAMDDFIEGANGEYAKIVSIGEDFARGFAQGIRNKTNVVISASEDMSAAASRSSKKYLLIGSPSRVMEEQGKFFDLGFARGIKRNADDVAAEAETLAAAASSAMAYNTASPYYGGSGGVNGASSRVANFGGINITIQQAAGQNAEDLAEAVMERIYLETNQRQAALGW